MTTRFVAPTGSRSIIEENGTMTQAFRRWVNEVNRALPILGAGTPENVIEGVQGQFYIDLDAAAGSKLFVKDVDDIGGDKSQGWELA